MALQLFLHPFSSYCQKVLAALYANGTPFTKRLLGPDQPENGTELAQRWSLAKFPLLLDGERAVWESSVIVEYLDMHHPGPIRFVPADPAAAIKVRMLDRIFDNYMMTPMQRIVSDAMRPEAERDPHGVDHARASLDKAYAWLDARIGEGPWAMGDGPTLADCAAAPALFYADWAHPIPEQHAQLRACRAHLLAWPPSPAPSARRGRTVTSSR